MCTSTRALSHWALEKIMSNKCVNIYKGKKKEGDIAKCNSLCEKEINLKERNCKEGKF